MPSGDRYTVKEISEIMGTGRDQTYEALRRGEVPSVRVGRLHIIPKRAFDRWWESAGGRVASSAPNDVGDNPFAAARS